MVKRYDFDFERLYPFEVKVYTQDNENVTNSAPVLSGVNYEFISQYKFGCDNQIWFYTLPEPFDAEDDFVTIEVDLGEAAEFLSFEPSSRTFIVAQDVITYNMTGSYVVTVDVHDYLDTTRYQFHFDVYCTTIPLPPIVPPPPILPIDLLPGAVQVLEPDSYVKPILLPVSFTGEATIWFPEAIELITDFERLTRNVRVVLDGVKQEKPVMEIRALRGEYSEESNLNLDWTVLSVTQRQFLI